MQANKTAFGPDLKKYRRARRVKGIEVAKEMNLSTPTISNLESRAVVSAEIAKSYRAAVDAIARRPVAEVAK